ncbi:hypothetical protein NEOLI_004952 [Neolecta irregularis DAH-3]|uniref:Uncharacterized protein n=1 Tax=Neolecta irregularis (strain DAH-3) TaxID=1198029 RepID=A0A1U7LLD9_NEOID|nr:hypothetical protein NEOLI_004952 [Neolecta irregularis DAH-3]|eukprot:OLL23448.1 hypothetical protein NEOLI_004952 [Neolecta irregularis DAH-3]
MQVFLIQEDWDHGRVERRSRKAGGGLNEFTALIRWFVDISREFLQAHPTVFPHQASSVSAFIANPLQYTDTMLYMHDDSIESIQLYDEPQPESLRQGVMGMQTQLPHFFAPDFTQHMKPINGSLSPVKHTPKKSELTAMFNSDEFVQILENEEQVEKLKEENIALKQKLFAQSTQLFRPPLGGSENDQKPSKRDDRRGKSLSPRKILAPKCQNELLRPHTADGTSLDLRMELSSAEQKILDLEAKISTLQRRNESLRTESEQKASHASETISLKQDLEALRLENERLKSMSTQDKAETLFNSQKLDIEAQHLRQENIELKDKIETMIVNSEFDHSILATRQKNLLDLLEFTQMELDFCTSTISQTTSADENTRLKDSHTSLEQAYRELNKSFEEARANWVRENKSWEIQCNKEAERAKRRGERVQRLQIELAKMTAEIRVLNEMRDRGWGDDDTVMI